MQYFIELFLVLIILIFPTFFSSPQTEIIPTHFSIMQILLFSLISLYFFFRVRDNIDYQKKQKKVFSILLSLAVLVFIFFNGFFWQWIGKTKVSTFPSSIDFSKILTQLFGFIVFAFYEETMYRFFIPFGAKKSIEYFTKKKELSKTSLISIEILALLLFALGHLYMGIFALLNALFSGIALRFLVIKTNSIFPGTIVHIIYNLFVYFSIFTKA